MLGYIAVELFCKIIEGNMRRMSLISPIFFIIMECVSHGDCGKEKKKKNLQLH